MHIIWASQQPCQFLIRLLLQFGGFLSMSKFRIFAISNTRVLTAFSSQNLKACVCAWGGRNFLMGDRVLHLRNCTERLLHPGNFRLGGSGGARRALAWPRPLVVAVCCASHLMAAGRLTATSSFIQAWEWQYLAQLEIMAVAALRPLVPGGASIYWPLATKTCSTCTRNLETHAWLLQTCVIYH